ncbi:myeloid-associated differentiation marker-like protein 2 [Notolabrus celidotus]|uniref:myeloid-associated differentiation marker-like protein 2 n=1 Tax=Notolabrus celidotus TaxID=1203425 RepID=UPI00148FE262|nr:myeloid-associated differentiation marker-like protein 2 [Notolabrus celidotus]
MTDLVYLCEEMGVIDDVKDTLSRAVFTPSTLLSGRGGLHMCQILLCLVTFILGLFRGGSSHTYWNYAMFAWAFCPIMTLIITIIEMFKLDIILNMFCMDWADFTTGMAMSSSLMTVSVAIFYANFYACLKCLYGLIVSVFAIVCGILYVLEVVKDKFLDKKKGSYLAALPGFCKVLEAFVSCMIFISLSGYRDQTVLILCVIAYAIPFPILPLIIATNILKKLKNCLPFNLDRFVFIFLVISVILYIFAAIMYPIFMFKNNPRPHDCPPSFCIWAIQFMVAFFTYVNLILFTLDLIFTLLGICGFKRT